MTLVRQIIQFDPQATLGQRLGSYLVITCFGLLFIFLAYRTLFGGEMGRTGAAYVKAQTAIYQKLSTPRVVNFPNSSEPGVKINKSQDTFYIRSYVTFENAEGFEEHRDWYAEVEDTGDYDDMTVSTVRLAK